MKKRKMMLPLIGIITTILFSACNNLVTTNSSELLNDSNPGISRSVVAPESNSKRVVAYFVEWGIYAAHDSYFVEHIPFDKITHINYAFVGVNPTDFSIELYDSWASLEKVFPGDPYDTPYTGNLGQFKKYKLQYPHIKVLISVGGWTKSHGFHDMAKTDTGRRTFARNIISFVREHELDGVDIDWEYPGVDRAADPNDLYDKGAPGGPEDTVNYTLLMQTLREELTLAGNDDNKYYELTAAVGVGYDKINKTEPGKYAQYLDAVNLMTYDMHGGWESLIGHQAPLYANSNDPHEPLIVKNYNVDWAVSEFLRLDVPAHKIILGVPFYSRGWNNVSGGRDADGNGTTDGMFGYGESGLKGKWGPGGQSPYFAMKDLEAQAKSGTSDWEYYWDSESSVPWLYNRIAKELYIYDNRDSISKKMDYALSKGLGGAMYWELDGDDWKSGYDLVNIIADKILGGDIQDTEAPSTPSNLQSITVTSNSVELSWTASTDNIGVVGYEIKYGSTIESVLSASAVITGLQASTNYSFSVLAKDAAGNISGETSITIVTSAPDTEAPSIPVNLTLGAITENSIALTWNASSDNTGIAGYEVLSGSTVVLETSNTSATVTGLNPETEYTFTVRAKDYADNYSTNSTSVTGTTVKTPAVVLATDVPAKPQISKDKWNGETSYTIAMNLWWGNNATFYELFENGESVFSMDLIDNTPNAQKVLKTFTDKANGTYTYVSELTNTFGTTSSKPLEYIVTKGLAQPDNEAPTAPANFVATVDGESQVTLSWTVSSDNVGVTGYKIYKDGVYAETVTSTTAIITGLTASTAYGFQITAIDAAENESLKTSEVTVTTDAHVEDAEAPSAPANLQGSAAGSTSVSLSWDSSTDNVGVSGYKIYKDGVLDQTVTAISATVSGLTESTIYSFTVGAIDAAGNESADSAVINITTGSSSSLEWALNVSYTAGEEVSYLGNAYIALVTHTSYSQSWNPVDAPTLWRLK